MRGRERSPALLERLKQLPLEELKALPEQDWEGLSSEDRERLGRHILASSPEERARADTAAKAREALARELTAALAAYREMLGAGDHGGAWTWLERLAERWREAGEEQRLEQLGDAFLPAEALELLAALESSLVLVGAAEAERRALRLEDPELLERILVVGSLGLWGDWEERLAPAWDEVERRVGGSVERDRRLRRRRAPARPRRKRAARARELVAMFESTMAETAAFYRELAPDGRALNARERARALERLEAGAACVRTIDAEADAFSPADHELFRPLAALLPSIQRSLVLAMSADPRVRGRAMPIAEAQARAFMLDQQVAHGASPAQAWQALQAAAPR